MMADTPARLRWMDAIHDLPPGNAFEVDSVAIAVASALFRHMSPDGRCYPSIRLLALETKTSTRSVQDRLARFERHGMLTVEHRPRRANGYRVKLGAWTAGPRNTAGRRRSEAPETVVPGTTDTDTETVVPGAQTVVPGAQTVVPHAETVVPGTTEPGNPGNPGEPGFCASASVEDSGARSERREAKQRMWRREAQLHDGFAHWREKLGDESLPYVDLFEAMPRKVAVSFALDYAEVRDMGLALDHGITPCLRESLVAELADCGVTVKADGNVKVPERDTVADIAAGRILTDLAEALLDHTVTGLDRAGWILDVVERHADQAAEKAGQGTEEAASGGQT